MVRRDGYEQASDGIAISFGFLRQLTPANTDYKAARRETYFLAAAVADLVADSKKSLEYKKLSEQN